MYIYSNTLIKNVYELTRAHWMRSANQQGEFLVIAKPLFHVLSVWIWPFVLSFVFAFASDTTVYCVFDLCLY